MQPLIQRIIFAGHTALLLGCLVLGTNALGDAEQESTRATIDDPQLALLSVSSAREHCEHFGIGRPGGIEVRSVNGAWNFGYARLCVS